MTKTQKKMARGVAWMVGARLTTQLLGIVSTVILARLLLPADFGLLAMATSIVGLLELLRAFSFDVAIIQRKEVDRSHYDSAWTLNLILGTMLSLSMIALAPATAAFYREARLETVLYALAAGWFLESFTNIGTVAFRRELDFQKEFLFMTAIKLPSFLVTLPLAYWLQSYWALVIGIVVGKFFSAVISYWMHPYRPRLSLAAAGDLFSFSGWVLLTNSLHSLNLRGMDFVIGRLAGPTGLGLYNLSFEISNVPTTQLAAPINRALIPGYSEIMREEGSLKQSYLDVLGLLALISIPAGIGIAAVARPLVTVLLGANWLDAIPLIEILGIYGALVSLGANSSAALLAMGRPKILTILAAARLALLIPAVVIGINTAGVLGAAWAVLGVTAVLTPVNFVVLLPILEVRIVVFIHYVWRPVLASAGMYWCAREAIDLVSRSGSSMPIVELICGILSGLVGYLAIVALLWSVSGKPAGAESMVLSRLPTWLYSRGTE